MGIIEKNETKINKCNLETGIQKLQYVYAYDSTQLLLIGNVTVLAVKISYFCTGTVEDVLMHAYHEYL
jgi:hypothetical protein